MIVPDTPQNHGVTVDDFQKAKRAKETLAVNLRLPVRVVARVDEVARRVGLNRTDVILEVLEQHLPQLSDLAEG